MALLKAVNGHITCCVDMYFAYELLVVMEVSLQQPDLFGHTLISLSHDFRSPTVQF
jgi:hypothetical protein